MKQFVYITLLLLCGFLNSHAQEVSPWEEAYNNLPQKHRDEFYEYARDFLENTYYTQMSLAIGEGVEFRVNFIADIFGDENEADAARFQPEFLPESGKERFLTPDSYLQALSTAFKESDELEFIVSNIEEDKYVHGYTSPLNCFTRLDYDLEIKRRGETLLKRRCRMCCLFPKASYKREVRLMQIEPLEDFYIASEASPMDENQGKEVKDNAIERIVLLGIIICAIIFLIGEKIKEYISTRKSKRMIEGKKYFIYIFTLILPVLIVLWGIYGFKPIDKYAQFAIGRCFEELGNNNPQAVIWYIKAAEQGLVNAQFKLGYCYQEGIGVSKDEKKALKWYAKAAEQGHTTAQYFLAYCYRYGIWVSKDEKKAVEWYIKAAEQGHTDAQNSLGYCFQNGIGIPKDEKKAVEWYRKAVEQGHAMAQNNLGYCYQVGIGVSKDVEKAVDWYTKSAEQGHATAQYNLGYCYKYGEGVTQDYTEAVKWYRKAAEQGLASAQFNLGYCYQYGEGVTQDYTEAVKWYRKAAEQGNATAQYNLGNCYENGIGVSKDGEKAEEWYTKAANRGDADAQKAIERLRFNFRRYLNHSSSIK